MYIYIYTDDWKNETFSSIHMLALFDSHLYTSVVSLF